MDTDGDGKIFKGELTSFMTRQNEAAAARLQLEVTDQGQNLFEVLDTDSDGVLSPREQRDAKSILAVADKNGDGALARRRAAAAVHLRAGPRRRRSARRDRGRCPPGPLDRQGQHQRPALVSQDGPQQRRRPEPERIRRPARGLPQARYQSTTASSTAKKPKRPASRPGRQFASPGPVAAA